MSDILYVIVPAYNESENIETFINDWYPVIEAHNASGLSRLVIINDGSKDNTEEILNKVAESRPLLVPLTKPNGGHGDTLLYGYSYAIEHGADYIFQTDSDGQTLPSEFDSFWEEREKYDAIFGNRTDRKDGSSRVFVERTLCFILRSIFKIKVPDANAPFRLMRSEIVDKYIKKMPEHYNLPNVMLVTYCKYYKENILFKPITFRPRQGGVNSINIKSIVRIGKQALVDFKEMKKAM